MKSQRRHQRRHRQGFFVAIITTAIATIWINMTKIKLMRLTTRLGPYSQRQMPLSSLQTMAPSWLPILSLSLNQVRSVLFILAGFMVYCCCCFYYEYSHSFASRDVASRSIRRLSELRGLPSLVALPLHRLWHPLPCHACHQCLPLLCHDLLMQQALQGGEGGELLGGL